MDTSNIKVARIDNRYVHGQVAARLIREFAITKALVISDLYAKDAFMSQLMKTMSFSGATIDVLSIADTVKRYLGGEYNGKTFCCYGATLKVPMTPIRRVWHFPS